MRLLIDTQIFIWSVMDNERLKNDARRIMYDAEQVCVSAASIWEISIKTQIGKLEGDPVEFVSAIPTSGFTELPIKTSHSLAVHSLPLYHRDPFDRILIAQAITESASFLTADRVLGQYSDLVITI